MTAFWKHQWQRNMRLLPGRNSGLVRCEPEWRWDPPVFEDWDVWIVLGGTGEIRIQGDLHPVTRGFTVCFPPGDWNVHADHDPKQPLHVFYCHFRLEGSRESRSAKIPPPRPAFLNTDPLLWATIRELSNLDTHATPLKENLLWQLLLRLEEAGPLVNSSSEERIRTLIRQIRESPAQARNIEEIARELSMSTGHFRRVFRQVSGQSPVDFIINCRIERAAYYLRETNLPIQKIAVIVGYRDVYFFSRQFKERTRLSPSALRRGKK